MKHNYLSIIAILAIGGSMLLQSNASGPASNGNRATGAPGDGGSTCVTCHSGGSFGDVTIELEVLDSSGTAVTEYVADALYSVEVSVSAAMGTPSGYGFQVIALEDAGDASLNSFSNAGTGVQLTTSNSRQYAEHSSASSTGTFSFEWTAPSEGTGDITFYSAANAINGNGGNGGDNAALQRFFLSELGGGNDTTDTIDDEFPEGLIELNMVSNSLEVYPNPATDIINIDVDRNDEVFLFDLQGKLQMNAVGPVLDIHELPSGVYIIRSGESLSKIMKL